MADTRSLALFSAKIAENAERYNDMVEEMKKIAGMAGEQELSVEERNLLSVGYKNLVGARRASWRILQSVEQSEAAKGNDKRVKLIQKYRAVVEKELDNICGEILELLDTHLIPSASSTEAAVFYLKMKADYHRYLSEFKTEEERKDAAEKTLAAYAAAQDKALAELPSTNPIRLGLALNFSVFYYEVMNEPEKACGLAKQVRHGNLSGAAPSAAPLHRPSTPRTEQRSAHEAAGSKLALQFHIHCSQSRPLHPCCRDAMCMLVVTASLAHVPDAPHSHMHRTSPLPLPL